MVSCSVQFWYHALPQVCFRNNTVGRELYDHTDDPSTTTFDQFENVNLVDKAEYASAVAALSEQLHDQFPVYQNRQP